MGMFDTFKFKESLFCPVCGKEHKDVQSKEFSCNLKYYKVGDKLQSKVERTGIYAEELYCFSLECDLKLKRMEIYRDPKVYIVEGTLILKQLT